MYPEAVALPGHDAGEVAVMGERGYLLQAEPPLVVVVIEQAQLYPIGVLRVDGEVGPFSVEGGSERVWGTGPDRSAQTGGTIL